MAIARNLAALLLLSIPAAGGCAVNSTLSRDCLPEVTANIRALPALVDSSGTRFVIAAATEIGGAQLRDPDEEGVPRSTGPVIPFVSNLLPSGAAAVIEVFPGVPFRSSYFAFLDSNTNKRLDLGEPFGLDFTSPHDTGCNPQSITIEIDSIRGSSSGSNVPPNQALQLTCHSAFKSIHGTLWH